jgi:hypothetical protein
MHARSNSRRDPLRVLIAGGGVAALEALLALRDLAGDRVTVELLSPRPALEYRPLAVAEPFGISRSRSYELEPIARDQGATLRHGALAEVARLRPIPGPTSTGSGSTRSPTTATRCATWSRRWAPSAS